MKKKILACGLGALIIGATFASPVAISLQSTFGEMDTTTKTQSYQMMITSTPEEGEIVSLLDKDSAIYKVASNYKKYCTKDYYIPGQDLYYPKNLTIAWECTAEANYYEFEIGLKEDLSDAKTYLLMKSSIELPDLFVAKTYYYRVTAKGGAQTVRSHIFRFKTAQLPRTITVPDTSNTRDIGGYFTVDGEYQVKQGMFYRGGAIGAGGVDTLLNVYGIKTDLDVRGDGSSTTNGSPLGPTVNYVECKGPYYTGENGSTINGKQEYREALLREIQTCAVKENYPIYLHCSLGRDRTGTLALLISGLLGVGEQDLFMDYELSLLSESGTRDDQTPQSIVGGPFRTMYEYLKKYSTGSLQQNIEKFMLDLGVTPAEIASIKEILLEKV